MLLGSQPGLGAYRALESEGLDGYMVSVSGQLDLRFVPFANLIAPGTLTPQVRFVDPDSDFHALARRLATRVESLG